MKSRRLAIAAVAAGLSSLAGLAFPAAFAARSPQDDPAASARPTAADFAWLSGSWQLGEGADLGEEHWTLPNGGTLIGMARTIRAGRTVFFEFLRLEETKDGVDYVAQPAGRPPVRFRCTGVTQRSAVFENPKHDFPTRITYTRDGDALVATTSGPEGSREKPQQFRFERAGDEVRLPD
jgi:hypothetical protein